MTGTRRVARTRILNDQRYFPKLCSTRLVQTGECTSTSSTFAESATPKEGFLRPTDKWGHMYLGQFLPSRRDIIVSSLGLHAKAFVC